MPHCLLHTMIRVGDLKRSIKFYTEVLGMKLLRTSDHPEDSYTLVFLGYNTEAEGTVLELTYNYGVSSYTHGEAFGHLCIGVDDVPKEMKRFKSLNIPVDYEDEVGFMGFIKDPDGYAIEILNTKLMLSKASSNTIPEQ